MLRVGLAGLSVLATACFFRPDLADSGDDQVIDPYSDVTIGARHLCAVDGTGRLYCWGANDSSQLARTEAGPLTVPTLISEEMGWTRVVAGAAHTCGLIDGRVRCWGLNSFGQVTGAPSSPHETPIEPSFTGTAPPVFTDLSAGAEHTCAIGDGQLWCWGHQDRITDNASFAIRVGTRTDWQDIALGPDHACGIAGEDILCWGGNTRNQVTDPPSMTVRAPTIVTLPNAPAHPIRVGAGEGVSCAIMGVEGDSAGELWCWGENDSAVIVPDAQIPIISTPTRVGTANDWSRIVVGYRKACAIHLVSGVDTAVCWGTGLDGGLGGGIWEDHDRPIDRANVIGPAAQVALGVWALGGTPFDEVGCIRDGFALRCWGSNVNGNLGQGTRTRTHVPIEILPVGGAWTQIYAGLNHTCAVDVGGALYCWGGNERGQVNPRSPRGLDDPCSVATCDEPLPYLELMLGAVDRVVAGREFTCARHGQKISCWGDPLVQGHQNPQGNGPYEVPGSWSALTGGPFGACGRYATGFECWGQVAGSTNADPSPFGNVLDDLDEVGLGDRAACGRLTLTRERICFGENQWGQHGSGNANVPMPPLADTSGEVMAVAFHTSHGCLINIGSVVQCWGRNTQGQAGTDSTTDPVISPNFVLNATLNPLTCQSLGIGETFSCAVCGGDAMCWGADDDAQLGRDPDTTAARFAAVEVPLPIAIDAVAGGLTHACAVGEGKLFCWGTGERGQLGDGSHATNLPIPIGPRE